MKVSSETPIGAQKAAKLVINVPTGLRPLLESLAREVIRNQPLDLYSFAFLYADNLVKIRQENGGVDPINLPELYEKFKNKLSAEAISQGLRGQSVVMTATQQTLADESKKRRRRVGDMAPPSPDQAAAKIQAAARGFVARRRVKRSRGELEAARSARACAADAYDAHRRPRRRRRVGGDKAVGGAVVGVKVGQNDATRPVLPPAPSNDVIKLNQAATKIQANVRGFLTRRKLSPVPLQSKSNDEKRSGGDISLYDELPVQKFDNQRVPVHIQTLQAHFVEPTIKFDDVDASASKIQAGVRGYLTRKHLAEQGLPVHPPGYQRSRSHSPNVPQLQANGTHASGGQRAKSPRTSGGSQSFDNLLSAIDDQQQRVEKAACKIQAGVRGYLTRKHLQEKGLPVHYTPHDFHKVHEKHKKETGETSM